MLQLQSESRSWTEAIAVGCCSLPRSTPSFDGLRAVSIKMTPAVIRTIAIALVQGANEQKKYHQSSISNRNQLVGRITPSWVEYF